MNNGYRNVLLRRRPSFMEDGLVKAIYSYTAGSAGELSFNKGDRMRVLDTEDEWWRCRHLLTETEGFAPSNYVAYEDTLESCDWYQITLTKREAENYLMDPKNSDGTFLIRKSESEDGILTLSIKHRNGNSPITVKHYRIKSLENDKRIYIMQQRTFLTLVELVEYYQDPAMSDPLICQLKNACPIPAPVLHDLSHSTKDIWEIPRSSIKLKKELGRGNFGIVKKGVWNRKTKVAVKTLKTKDTVNQGKFLAEAKLMKKLRHKNVVPLLAVCTREMPYMIVTELMVNGALHNYLNKDSGRSLKLDDLVDIAGQIAAGMAYLEREHYIHRDLAARNVLVGENNVIKVADFGLARLLDLNDDEYDAQTDKEFAVKWAAPESILQRKFTTKSDVWSFGIVLYEIFTYGGKPYPGMDQKNVIPQIERGFRMLCPRNCPPEYYEMMCKCWEYQPQDRPPFRILSAMINDYN